MMMGAVVVLRSHDDLSETAIYLLSVTVTVVTTSMRICICWLLGHFY
jgi:hypothetical protein